VTWALERSGRTLESAPEGKAVEGVEVVAEEVFAPSDPYPLLLNLLHVRTREAVIRREVLLQPGEAWDAARAAETERNLRRLFYLAVAKVVPARGERGGVVLVVATKDKWSLRLNNTFTLVGSLLQTLSLQLVEVDFNGWGQSLVLATTLTLDQVSATLGFQERRLFGSRWGLTATGGLVFNRATGFPEGTQGEVALGQPLLSLDQSWAAVLDVTWNLRPRRVYRGAEVWQLPYPDDTGSATVPLVYGVRELQADLAGTRSFGTAFKVDVTLALDALQRQYTPPTDSGLDDARRTWLIDRWLPRSETATSVVASVRAYQADYRVLTELETFQLSEDVQLGLDALARVRWAFPLPFAPASFVELSGAAHHRWLWADDLLAVSAAGTVRLRPGEAPVNQRLAAEVVNYSPHLFGGRLVTRVLLDLRWNDLDHRQVLLGGATGLRGAPPESQAGANLLLVNVEYRTRPFEAWASWLGLVFFYDLGSAYDRTPALTHTCGVGLRLLLPQLNREVIRLDLGLVIGGPLPGAGLLNASWDQVTALRPAFLDTAR
jgi:hypothetical protein